MSEPKYAAVADESGSWSVIDTDGEIPAVLDSVPQVGLGQDQAKDIAAMLNAMMDGDDG